MQIITILLAAIILTGCASAYKENGYENQQDWDFAQSLNGSSPQRIAKLKIYNVNTRADLDKIIAKIKSENYANNWSWETIFEYLGDEKEAKSLGITVAAQKEKRKAEEKLADKERFSQIIKKNESSVLLVSKFSDSKLLIVDSEEIVNGSDSAGKTIGFTVQSQYKKPISFKGGTGAYAIVKGYLYCIDGSGRFTNIQVHSGSGIKSPKVYSQNIDSKIESNGRGEFINRELKDLMCTEARKKGVLITESDFKSVKDVPIGREYNFKDFSLNLKSEICKNIKTVNKYSILSSVRYQGEAFEHIYNNGGGGWVKTGMIGDKCFIVVSLNGVYKGTGYNKNFTFPLINTEKNPDGTFHAQLISIFEY